MIQNGLKLGPRSSRQEKRMGKERGRARETGEGSPLAGEDNRQKPLPKGRLSTTVIFVLKLCLFYILNLLLNKLSSRVLNLICETEANVKFKELSG